MMIQDFDIYRNILIGNAMRRENAFFASRCVNCISGCIFFFSTEIMMSWFGVL